MRRRGFFSLIVIGAAVPSALARAQPGLASLRIAGAARDGQARFRLVNRTADVLAYTSYDGGNVHNELERLEGSGAWSSVGLGYCGLGADGEVLVPAGATHVLRAYVGSDPGTYRIRVTLERRPSSGSAAPATIVSEPFRVR